MEGEMVTLKKLLKKKKYRKMSLEELVHVINFELGFDDYYQLPGLSPEGKAKLLSEYFTLREMEV